MANGVYYKDDRKLCEEEMKGAGFFIVICPVKTNVAETQGG